MSNVVFIRVGDVTDFGYRFYANIMVLLFAYRPVYHCEPPPDVLLVIKRSMATMELWDKVPFMSEALSRMKQFAIQGGWDQAPVDES